MKFGDKIKQLGLRLRFTVGIVSAEWSPKQGDKEAAWKMYIELLTRVTTQALPNESGNEQSALASIHSLFDTTRSVLKEQGQDCIEFTKIAIGILNQVVRPFTTKWHKISLTGDFEDPSICEEFRQELDELQMELRVYMKALAKLAEVEDLTELSEISDFSCVEKTVG
ncbi:hypothetical protein F4X73_02555 [Candidatus Poribacteria bacterium]|nr:hypothetical protein [Candidatus Poribacteria bacterium]